MTRTKTINKMKLRHFLLALLVVPTLALPSSISHLEVQLKILDSESLDAEAAVEPTLGLVPGAIFGLPTENVFPVSGSGVHHVSFPLIYLLGPINSLIQSANDSRLNVDPANTRFGRISTGGRVFGQGSYPIGGGFKNRSGELDLLLMYVEGPCTISGVMENKTEVFHVELSFEKSGFYWISINKEGHVRNESVLESVVFELFGRSAPSD